MPRPIHFELAADDPERAARFYRETFGWKVDKWEGPMEYWLITTGNPDQPGIDGGLGRRDEPGEGTVNTLDVPSVDEYVERITRNGGTVVRPKHAVPGVGYLAYCRDTEGNLFGIMEDDPTAQ